MIKRRKKEKGQILIESVVAISIGVVGLLGFLQLLSQSVAFNKNIGQQFVATYLAAEGIEVVRSLIDANYADGIAWNTGLSDGTYEVVYNSTVVSAVTGNTLYRNPQTGVYSYAVTTEPTTFKRKVEITADPSELGNGVEMRVVAAVSWTARGGDSKEVVLEDHFFDWRP